jgi:hypothetical protein
MRDLKPQEILWLERGLAIGFWLRECSVSLRNLLQRRFRQTTHGESGVSTGKRRFPEISVLPPCRED